MRNPARAMTIAGSDSGGGAGIQADLKTFAAMGVYGTSILTAITAQNTQTVTEVVDMPDSIIRSQIDAVIEDIGADAVKTGMLSGAGIIEIVAEKVTEHGMTPLVVDPVMVAKGGARLLREDAVEAPQVCAHTPSDRGHAQHPRGRGARRPQDRGHGTTCATPRRKSSLWALDPSSSRADTWTAPRPTSSSTEQRSKRTRRRASRPTTRTERAAPSHRPSLPALAKGLSVRESVSDAKKYVTEAIRFAPAIGKGNGPLNHFYTLRG